MLRGSAGITLESGATLSGNAYVRLTDLQKDYPSRIDINLQTFTLKAGAHLAPGANTAGNFGAVGLFELENAFNNYITFAGSMAAGSHLDLDIADATTYDSLKLTQGNYSSGTFKIEKGAQVNINAIGTLNPGTYNIITAFASTRPGYTSGNLARVSNGGLVIGTAPAGFDYTFQDVITQNYLGTIVTAVNLVVSTPNSGSTWTPGTSAWSTDTNWVGGTNPNAAGTTATFAGNTTASVNVDAPRTVGRILLSGADYTFTGSALTLDNTGGAAGLHAQIRANSNSHTFNNSVVAGATDVNIHVAAGAGLNFAGGIDNTAGKVVTLNNDGGTLTITGFNNGNTTGVLHSKANAAVSNLSGAGKLLVSAGTLTLAGSNTFSGETWLAGGKLSISSLDNLGTSGIRFRGGSLQITGTAITSIPASAIVDGAGFYGFDGGFDIADPSNSVTVSSNLGSFGGGTLVKEGPGTLVLSGANSLKGNIYIKNGTVRITGTNGGYSNVIPDGGTLGGSGTISGAVIAGAAPHTIFPSAALAPGSTTTLVAGRLATNASTTLKFNLTTPAGVSDKIIVTQTNRLNISNGANIAIGSTGTGPSSLGYFNVIQYIGTLTGNASNLVMPAPAPDDTAYFATTTFAAGYITLHRGFLGDANDDGTVAFNDFVALANNFGQAGSDWHDGDFNNDGTVAFNDFVILANNFGQTYGGGGGYIATAEEIGIMQAFAASAAPVPEPATLSVLGLSAALLLTRRTRRR